MITDNLRETNSIIKVIGVGGGGSNAVNFMFNQGIEGVNFAICNTDAQALDASPVPTKIQLGPEISKGLGAGSLPDVGRQAALESLNEVVTFLSNNTHMVFITAGMGGGTGTGAAPIIAKAAKEMGLLTVGIVTLPFKFEGPKRKKYADEGLEELKKYVDSIIIISNDKVRTIYGDLKMREAFSKADNVLTTAAKGIAELITKPLEVNVDFADVKTVMSQSGVALMGSAFGKGNNRAIEAVTEALNSPLLSDNDIKGARNVLFSVTYGKKAEISMDELAEITDYIMEEVGENTDLFWGHGFDDNLDDELQVTIVATGFNHKTNTINTANDNVKKLNFDLLKTKEETSLLHDEVEVDYMDMKLKNIENPTIENNSYEKFTLQENEPIQKVNFTLNDDRSIELETISEKTFEDNNAEITIETQSEIIFKSEKNEIDDMLNFKTKSNVGAQSNPELIKEGKTRLQNIQKEELKALNFNKTSINDLENQPAFMRRTTQFEDFQHSSESNVSQFSVGNDEQQPIIRPNNSYLWGNVD
jgi:cell division protein FtsZ